MATAKKAAAKKPAAKKAAPRPAAKKAAKRPVARKPAAKPAAKPAKKSGTAKRKVQALQKEITAATGKILSSGRKDLDALMKVNKNSYSKLQSLVKRRTDLLKSAIKEWQAAAKEVDVVKLEALGKDAFKMALENIRELADLAAKSQSDAFKIVKKNIEGNVNEVSKLLKK